jgi:hypothetical protein
VRDSGTQKLIRFHKGKDYKAHIQYTLCMYPNQNPLHLDPRPLDSTTSKAHALVRPIAMSSSQCRRAQAIAILCLNVVQTWPAKGS